MKHDATMIINTSTAKQVWCVFEHLAQFAADKPPEVIFVSHCPLRDVYKLIEGQKNTEWQRIFASGGMVMVRIIATCDEKHEAVRATIAHLKGLPKHPRCNSHGTQMVGRARPIIELESKVVYKSQGDAAEKLGIAASAISRHMNGQLNHVCGYTFEYKS